jgi:hypothetical protein
MIPETDAGHLRQAALNIYQASVYDLQVAEFRGRPSIMLGLIPHLDGNQWCALLGKNLQEGIAGFGDTPDNAMFAFDDAWYGRNRKDFKP